MGIEASIVQKYQLPHALKERLVDILVLLLFGDELSDYSIQPMGDSTLDTYLKTKNDLVQLPTIMNRYLSN